MNALISYKLNGAPGIVGHRLNYNGFEGYKVAISP